MLHLPQLILDLTLILIAAGIVTVLFKAIRQPVVLGYILAGLLVSPHVPIFPTVVDEHGIRVWAEIGIIILLFALGLEFSFKKLARVGGSATITAVVEISSMLAIGFATGMALGWSTMDSLFLGGILSVSSTTIIIRAFEEAGVKGQGFVSLVFGALIVEDLVAILLLVLLSTVAVSRQFEGSQMAFSLGKLGFFLTLWFLSGIFIIPTLLKRLRRHLSSETLLIISLGLCFLMVVLATRAGFSPALGAFIMGSILAETTEAERIEHLIAPVKDLFAAIFFVSVGMLIDPTLLLKHAGPVLLITCVTIAGKLLSTMFGSLLSGQNLKHSVQAGMSLAQIGEFSFIIAGLGQSLKVTSDYLYPIAVGVSAITTFSTPYLIRSSERVYRAIERAMPAPWVNALNRYHAQARNVSATSEWSALVRSYAIRISVNGVIISAIFLFLSRVLRPRLAAGVGESGLADLIGLDLALVASAPFLWALTVGRPKGPSVTELWKNRRNRAPALALELFRISVGIALVAFLSLEFVSVKIVLTAVLGVAALSLFVFSRHLDAAYQWFERRFLRNLSEREVAAQAKNPPLVPWDAHIARFEVSADAPIVGKTLSELGIRERFGVTLALIERGQRRVSAPNRDERIYPCDRISVIGTDEQIARFKPELEGRSFSETEQAAVPAFSLQSARVPSGSPLVQKMIRESGLRKKADGIIVGIERNGQRILNPDSTLTIQEDDLLWLVVDENRLHGLKESGELS